MQVRAILDQKGLPRRTVRLSCSHQSGVFVDGELVLGVEQGEYDTTVCLRTGSTGMFILVDDYQRFLKNELSATHPELAAALS